MERLYKRQARKLEKLRSRADVEQQAANVKKYNRRAGIAAGVGLGAAGVAVGMKYRNGLLKKIAANQIAGYNQAWDATYSGMERKWRNMLKEDRQAYDAKGNWTGKGYTEANNKRIDAMTEDYMGRLDNLDSKIRSTRETFNRGARIRKGIATAATGVAAVSVGLSVYNKIQAHVAKKRMSEVGHQKAVQNVKNQMAKMEKMFADTPYSQLVKDQQKQGLERSKKKR